MITKFSRETWTKGAWLRDSTGQRIQLHTVPLGGPGIPAEAARCCLAAWLMFVYGSGRDAAIARASAEDKIFRFAIFRLQECDLQAISVFNDHAMTAWEDIEAACRYAGVPLELPA